MVTTKQIAKIETRLLLEAIFDVYGYEFKNYASASLNRRIAYRMQQANIETISELIPRMIHDVNFFNSFLKDMSISVTDMFRDPKFFKGMRNQVIPLLKTYPFAKIWHAGCCTGEEVYSLAILLKEEGYYDKARIYATDYNNHSLEVAKKAIYPIENLRKYTTNYNKTGGKNSLSDYYTSSADAVKFVDSLKANVTFANHNLAQDSSFGEINLIVCRNVLMYFNTELQNRVLRLFNDSLVYNGILCLGQKESLLFSDIQDNFELIDTDLKIYRKKLPTDAEKRHNMNKQNKPSINL
ncbi:MAG: chemotaxis protein methyltransferase CheR [Polaribacter sp.]|jgi:chemotaxis protein methyltransferase CheR